MSVATPPVTPTVEEPEDDAIRNYLFVALSALLVVVLVLMRNASGNLVVLIGVVPALLGLFMRWTAMPGVFLLTLSYLQLYPTGLPFPLQENFEAPTVLFRMHDFLLLGAALVYFICQFRLFSLTVQAVPSDRLPTRKKTTDRPIRRSQRAVNGDELYRLFVIITACVLIAQAVWFVLSIVVVDVSVFPPIKLISPSLATKSGNSETGGVHRFLFLIGLVGSVGLVVGFVFWYRGLQWMRADHAKMFMLDTAWRETRSELSRQEKWRAWGQGTFHAVSGKNPGQGPGLFVVVAVFIALFLLALVFGSVLIYALL